MRMVAVLTVLCAAALAGAQPVTSAAGPVSLAVFDPGGTVAARLKAKGTPFLAIDGVAALVSLPAGVRLVVAGPNALKDPDARSDAWRKLGDAGVSLLVLEQVYPSRPLRGPAVPVDTWVWESNQPVRLDAAAARHAVFAGVDAEAFEKWAKPAKFVPLYGALRQQDVATFDPNLKSTLEHHLVPDQVASLGVSAEASIYSPVLVYPSGKALGILCQLPVGERLRDDPIAQRIFDNLLAAALK